MFDLVSKNISDLDFYDQVYMNKNEGVRKCTIVGRMEFRLQDLKLR